MTKNIFYKLQFFDSARFMASSLSNLVDNLAKRIHKIKCKDEHNNNRCETYGIKYKDCQFCLEYTNFYVATQISKKTDKKLRKRFVNTCKFSNHDINKFILLL